MSKPRLGPRHLRSVPAQQRPLAKLSQAEKLVEAIRWLRERNRYVLDQGANKPTWGLSHCTPEETPLMKSIMELDRRRK